LNGDDNEGLFLILVHNGWRLAPEETCDVWLGNLLLFSNQVGVGVEPYIVSPGVLRFSFSLFFSFFADVGWRPLEP